ncbi:MAG: potassium transporter TrkG, partial [candidate division WOR-3 bacterium]
GGVKTTNFAILAAFLRSIFRGEEEVYLSKRRIENNLLIESLMIFSLYIFIAGLCLFLILIVEGNRFDFTGILFEVISALSTVGLSLGSKIYPNLSLSTDFSPVSKLVIIFLMIIGRIGVFTVWSILITRKKTLKSYPKGELLIV